MSARTKRYKVVQDANGDLGILDTLALELDSDAEESFAAWEECSATEWLDEILWWATGLNAGTATRSHLAWSTYRPRVVAS